MRPGPRREPPRSRIRWWLWATLGLVGVGPLEAHPLSASYSRFTVRGPRLEATVRLPLDDMDLLLRLDGDLDGVVSESELRRAQATIARYLRDQVRVTADGVTIGASLWDSSLWRDGQRVSYLEARARYTADRPIGSLVIQVRALSDLYGDHRNLAEIDFDGRREEFVFQHGSIYTAERGGARLWRAARQFTGLGIEHIFTGYDHILFLFGLLLGGRGLRNLVAIATSFTVAHSLTLALATLGVVRPPTWITEAAIALSIAYVGLENLLVADLRQRWKITFAFGLVHGFGFASVLREMELPRSGLALSLFTFNLGVEIGQVAILALMWPLLCALERTARRALATRLLSSAIAACGFFWFVQRVP